jgi:hypothetical protein
MGILGETFLEGLLVELHFHMQANEALAAYFGLVCMKRWVQVVEGLR